MWKKLVTAGSVATLMAWTAGVQAADVEAGKAKVEEICADCHDPADWEGEDAATLQSMIKDVVSGTVKHKKKLDLTDAEIANIAAYWASGG
jgi:mono/diheme cytochrome c family protein